MICAFITVDSLQLQRGKGKESLWPRPPLQGRLEGMGRRRGCGYSGGKETERKKKTRSPSTMHKAQVCIICRDYPSLTVKKLEPRQGEQLSKVTQLERRVSDRTGI